MARVNFPITIDELIECAKKAKNKYGGDRYVLISNDEEGNGFHECYYEFNDAAAFAQGDDLPRDLDPAKCVVLG